MAAANHRIHQAAQNELAEALRYLAREAPEQVQRFKATYRAARLSLRKHPLTHAPLFEDYRRSVLLPFRYMIVYVTDGTSTDILAVRATMRDPDILKADLEGRTFE